MTKSTVIRGASVVGLLGVTLSYGWVEIKAQGADLMPINYVRVEGAFQYIGRDEIKKVLAKQLMHGFYNADLQRIQDSVTALSWVEKVEVQRVWPDAIKVRIREQRPVARWGGDSLLNARGELFVPASVAGFESLPVITGPEGQEQKLLEVMKGLSIALRDRAMVLKEFYVNERRAWKVVLTNGMEIKLGRKAPLANIQRFLRTVELLGPERVAMMATVDLRYPNGYAVTWKANAEKIDWEDIVNKESNRA
ncbi:cell division protein FtsQ/DivIB [Methylomarinum sp. Ch1-1]|uniref:Cell division protein FtsQ n=1 Tax=Methylomarinum roseum TaxID=3067653 RepID=A0AAU7NXQ7_9GAMM|nr:cell division protein FtsQ/DivIB [Methylomarinum sp. Ch1-1]MDP4522164.1 cell division protein FtsQ/DivIB [Methylomarinum sp. Ch1-1]